jgi:hypothetical protein
MSEEIELVAEKSDSEFTGQQDLAAKRIDHIILVQDRLRNHIANLEAINQILEQKISTSQGEEKIKTVKSLSYNYERLIKLYEVYQSYEQVIQRYHVHVTDTINKKYQINTNLLKNKQDPTSLDFYRRLNDFFVNSPKEDIDEISKIEDPRFKL